MAPTTTAPTTDGLIAAGAIGDTPNPFALPRGLKGRLAGWYMGRPDRQHHELARLVPLQAGVRVIEVGFGPGQLLAALAEREPTLRLAGVDPSELMVGAARRRNPHADLRVGAAAVMPFADAAADLVLAVNNAPMWPDPAAALAEIRRVLAPSGTLFVAWHGGSDPRGHQKRLVLDRDRFGSLDTAFRRAFPIVRHRSIAHSELWEAQAAE
jgi:SAM-dependent methyltransferase